MRESSRPALRQVLMRAWTRSGPLAWLLWPVSLLFGALVLARQGFYRAGFFKSRSIGVPVIVVGNVVAGGAGKTPVVMALVQHLQARGLRAGVVSRGYGRRTQDCREVHADSPASEVGDEPALVKRTTSAPVFVARQRFEAASALIKQHPGIDIIVCDDGLQHYGLQRDIDVCVFDDRGVGNGFLLPAGPLREPWPRRSFFCHCGPAGTRPAQLVLHTGAHPAFGGFTSQRALSRCAVRADGTRRMLAELAQSEKRPLLALAAIARPEVFFAMLRAQHLTLALTLALPDHYDFDGWVRPADRDYLLICTEKDAVKLWARHPDALAVALEFSPEPAFLAALDNLLPAKANAKLSSPHGHTTS